MMVQDHEDGRTIPKLEVEEPHPLQQDFYITTSCISALCNCSLLAVCQPIQMNGALPSVVRCHIEIHAAFAISIRSSDGKCQLIEACRKE